MPRGKFHLAFHMAILSLIFIYGYLEELATQQGLNEKTARIAIILLIFTHAIVLNCLSIKKRGRTSGIFPLLFTLLTYGFLIAAVQGGTVSALSPTIRLWCFLLISMWIYSLWAAAPGQAQRALDLFFSVSAAIIILQTLIDYAIDRNIFMNGGYRYFGSIGSPIGFAASILVVQIGIIYLWLAKSELRFFLCMIGLGWAVIMSGTRSISFFSLLLIWAAILVNTKGWAKFACFFTIPAVLFLTLLLIPDISVVSRIENTLANDTLDNSTSFRVFILDAFAEHITSYQLLFGLGLGQFHEWFLSQTGIENVAPHFEALWILAEFGLAGSLVYLLIVALLLLGFLTRFRSQTRAMIFLIISSFLTHQIFLQFANPFYFYQFYVPFALIFGSALFHLDPLPLRTFSNSSHHLETTQRGATQTF